jgi:hypothetical protein
VAVGARDLPDPIDVGADHLEGLPKAPAARPAHPSVELVLGHDQPHNPVTLGHAADALLRESVLLRAKSKTAVAGEHGHVVLPVQALEQREGIGERPVAHVGEVDQHPLADHRPHGGLPQVGQSHLGLGEEASVEPVRQERDRGGVGRHVAPHQMRDGDIGDPTARELRDGAVDLGRRPTEVVAALDAVDERDLALVERPLELEWGVRDDRRLGVPLADVLLHRLDIAKQRRKIRGLRLRRVGLAELELVEERRQHRQRDAHLAFL